MLEVIFSCFHRFSGVKKTPKSVVIESFGGTVQKLWQNKKFGSLTSIFGYNFTQNLRNIEFSQAKRLTYLIELFFWHILAKYKENPRNGISAKSQKLQKMAFFSHKWAVFEKKAKISKKRPFLTFFIPNFVPSFGKSLERFLRYSVMDAHTILIL